VKFRFGEINVPFFVAGALKIAYDLLLYRQFVHSNHPKRSSHEAMDQLAETAFASLLRAISSHLDLETPSIHSAALGVGGQNS
jgi:hypothetical protein